MRIRQMKNFSMPESVIIFAKPLWQIAVLGTVIFMLMAYFMCARPARGLYIHNYMVLDNCAPRNAVWMQTMDSVINIQLI